MDHFHIIDDAQCVLVSRGVYRQAKLYRRGEAVYAGYGGGFIRLYREGTSAPTVRCDAIDLVGVRYDKFDRALTPA